MEDRYEQAGFEPEGEDRLEASEGRQVDCDGSDCQDADGRRAAAAPEPPEASREASEEASVEAEADDEEDPEEGSGGVRARRGAPEDDGPGGAAAGASVREAQEESPWDEEDEYDPTDTLSMFYGRGQASRSALHHDARARAARRMRKVKVGRPNKELEKENARLRLSVRKAVTAVDLRRRTSEIIAALERNEELMISYRDRWVGIITPINLIEGYGYHQPVRRHRYFGFAKYAPRLRRNEEAGGARGPDNGAHDPKNGAGGRGAGPDNGAAGEGQCAERYGGKRIPGRGCPDGDLPLEPPGLDDDLLGRGSVLPGQVFAGHAWGGAPSGGAPSHREQEQ